MTIKECEKRNVAVLQNAERWAEGVSCQPLEQFDIALLGEYLSMNIPKAFYDFICSENTNHCKATGDHKAILKTLDTIKNKIKSGKLKY